MTIYQFNIHLPWFRNIDRTSLYYKRYCLKTWYFEVYDNFMLIIPKDYMKTNYGLYSTKHLFTANIIKVNGIFHKLTIQQCMKIISRHWYIPYIKRYQKHCELFVR